MTEMKPPTQIRTNAAATTKKGTAKLPSAMPDTPWLTTWARVISCKYQFARMHTLTLGVFTDRGQFLITFTYHAHGQTFNDQFDSPVPIEQNQTFELFYNPMNPQQNNKSAQADGGRAPLIAYGIGASVLCSLLVLVFARGCN
jgi:hypothetical protein